MIQELINRLIEWANANSGFVTVLLFLITILFGWVTGIFRTLMNRPKLKIDVNEGPTLSCTFDTGRSFNNHKTHRTAISLYLHVTNIGSAPTDIENIHIGYHNHTLKNTFLWFWLTQRMNSLSDFHITLGGYVKVYPFLVQVNTLSPIKQETYLPVGKSTGGIVYFEQEESWGGLKPRVKNGQVKVKIRLKDSFGSSHSRVVSIPQVELGEARKFNPEFGNTIDKSRVDHPSNQETVNGSCSPANGG